MLNMSNKAIKAPNKNELMKVNKKAQAIEMVALNIGKAKEGSTTNPIKFVKRSD